MSVEPGPRKHPVQRLMDNPWWLLLLGVLIPFLSFTLWGWIEPLTLAKDALP